jgi:flagellar protein FlgJ
MENMPINGIVSIQKALSPTTESGGKKIDREKLKKACTDFEALFMAQMLKFMRQSLPQTGFFGKGVGSDIYQSLMDQQLSQELSQSKGLGLGTRIYQQVLRREEKAPNVSPERPPFKPLAERRSEE